jgi:hypothetical protein
VSEQQAEQTSGETGSLDAGPSGSQSSDAKSEPVTASAPEISVVESPQIAPDHEAPKADEPKPEAPRAETPKLETPKLETAKAEPPKAEAPRIGKLMIMARGERTWSNEAASEPKAEQGAGTLGKRRFAAVAAMVALATVAGALGGALATAGFGHLVGSAEATSPANSAIEASVARIDADILTLKASLEHTSKMGMSQFNKTSDRLDRLEKAIADPAAKLAKLSEALDRLRAAPAAAAPAAVAAAPKEVTGSVAPSQAAAAPAVAAPATAAPKVEVSRLPTVEGWVLTDVGYGGALIENRRGSYEVYAGDSVPGLGRIDAIRRQDGRWVVVTSKGLIVAR